MTAPSRPANFDSFWEQVDRDLERYPARPELELLPVRSSERYTVYALKLTSLGPYRIFGYYSVPTGAGPFAGLLQTPGYGSVNHLPAVEQRERYAVLQIMHRGQRLADEPYAASFPGLLTDGLADPASYIYRGIVADCLRGAEFLLARPEVDPARVGVVGDDLALLTAARRPSVTVLQVTGFLLYRLLDTADRGGGYPAEELNDELRLYPAQRPLFEATLTHFDARYHAPLVKATAQLAIGGGQIGGREWLEPLLAGLRSDTVTYQLTGEGATDNDALDSWLAGQLGVPGRRRLRR